MRCHGGNKKSAVGVRGVLLTVHNGGWIWLVDAMCLLAEGGLYHILYVILYGDNNPTVTRGTGGYQKDL